jgi:hypothetical protein
MKSDFFMITDTLPYEIPLHYSNKDLQEHVNSHTLMKNLQMDDLTHLKQSVPYNFHLMKNNGSKRLMSLVNPLAQIQMNAFKDVFANDLIEFCKNHAIFSIRYPSGINSSYTNIKTIDKDLSFLIDETKEYSNNEFENYIDSYFEKMRFNSLPLFYKSNQFKKYEIKFNTLLKMDIKSCFDNIYTHSFDWAYLGSKELAKDVKDIKSRFSYILDKLMQVSNYNESKGIVVGPEFSRCIVEIILMRVDQYVYKEVENQGLTYKVDYEIVRYMDDIFIFANNQETCMKVKDYYEIYCKQFKLDINESKVYFETRPFLKKNGWNPGMKRVIKDYFKELFVDIEKDNVEKNNFSMNIANVNNHFVDSIRKTISDFDKERDKIVNFVLKSFYNRRKTVFDYINKLNDSQKTFFLCSLIDTLQYTLTFSTNFDNVLRFVLMNIKIYTYSSKKNLSEVQNILFKNCFELLKYNQNHNIEFLNLIIFLRRLKKDIPEQVILSFMEKDLSYFTLGTVAFYISTNNRKYRYKLVRTKINKYINKVALNIKQEICDIEKSNPNSARKILNGEFFYLLHDFYRSDIIYKSTREVIEEIINWISKVNWPQNDKIYQVFWDYVKDFDKPFLQFKYSDDDIVEKILFKTKKQSMAYN